MRVNGWTAVAALATMAGAALGQNEVIYDVTTPGADVPDLSTAPSLAVSEDRVVVMGSHRMMMFDKSLPIDPSGPPSLLDDVTWSAGYSGYPFQLASNHLPAFDIIPGLTYARADYDPITGNVWMLYSETIGSQSDSPVFIPAQPEIEGGSCIKRLHLAASKHPGFDTFDTTAANGFEYVTGTDAVRLDVPMTKYRPGDDSNFYETDPAWPSFGFDTSHIFIAAMDAGECGIERDVDNGFGQTILILPRQFGTSLTTVHAGGIPQPQDFTIIRPPQLAPVEDDCFQMMAVQEPYEQYPNLTLFISTDGTAWQPGTPPTIDGIRLRGVYQDGAGQWQVRQSLQPGPMPATYILQDALIPSPLDDLIPVFGYDPPSSIYPATPSFDPTVENGAFHTTLLTEDN